MASMDNESDGLGGIFAEGDGEDGGWDDDVVEAAPHVTQAQRNNPDRLPPATQRMSTAGGKVIDLPASTTEDPAPEIRLVAQWRADGSCVVARSVNGNQVEAWRAPTKQEWDLLKTRGQVARMGLASGGSGGPLPGNGALSLGEAPVTPWYKTPWAMAGGAALLAAGGYVAYRRFLGDDGAEDSTEE